MIFRSVSRTVVVSPSDTERKMTRKRELLIVAAALGLTAGLPGPVAAQSSGDAVSTETPEANLELEGATVRLRVDGMTCPFCAYGLEKKLGELESVDELIIRVSDGVVLIRLKEGMTLADDDLSRAVERGGFSLREVERVAS